MTTDEILKYVGILISGTLIKTIFDFFIRRKETKIKEKESSSNIETELINTDLKTFELLKATWREEFERYEEKLKSLLISHTNLETKVDSLHQENLLLKDQISDLKSLHPDMPIPMWLKDHTGKMLSLNQAYEDMFLIPQNKTREDYINNYDDSIWSDDIATVFRDNDLIATAKKTFIEIQENELDHPLLKNWRFYKYPVYSQGVFVGIAGIALPKN